MAHEQQRKRKPNRRPPKPDAVQLSNSLAEVNEFCDDLRHDRKEINNYDQRKIQKSMVKCTAFIVRAIIGLRTAIERRRESGGES